MNPSGKISIAIADDHVMLRKGLIKLLATYGKYTALFDVDDGNGVITHLQNSIIPDVLILDVNMAGKGGYETAQWVSEQFPQIKILALSMSDDEHTILKMIAAGVRGYITKNSEPEKLKEAIDILYDKGVYLPESLSASVFRGIKNNLHIKPAASQTQELNENEKLFLSLLCKEYSYPEIAKKMLLSPRTMDDYRRKLSAKLHVKGKSGLIVYAMNNGLNSMIVLLSSMI